MTQFTKDATPKHAETSTLRDCVNLYIDLAISTNLIIYLVKYYKKDFYRFSKPFFSKATATL